MDNNWPLVIGDLSQLTNLHGPNQSRHLLLRYSCIRSDESITFILLDALPGAPIEQTKKTPGQFPKLVGLFLCVIVRSGSFSVFLLANQPRPLPLK